MSNEDTKNETKPQRTPEELRKALHTCETQLREVKAARKAMMGAYKDQLKDIDDEITGILEQLKQLESKEAK